jgi:hypothetical protein
MDSLSLLGPHAEKQLESTEESGLTPDKSPNRTYTCLVLRTSGNGVTRPFGRPIQAFHIFHDVWIAEIGALGLHQRGRKKADQYSRFRSRWRRFRANHSNKNIASL